jgi:hypothetical protein
LFPCPEATRGVDDVTVTESSLVDFVVALVVVEVVAPAVLAAVVEVAVVTV